MASFSSWLCNHRWDGAWDRDAHECSKCGHRQPHEWQLTATTPACPQGIQFECKACGALKIGSSRLRTPDNVG